MRRRWMVWALLSAVCLLATAAQAVEIGGTLGTGVDLLPAFGANADLEITLSGDTWSLSSDTNVDLAPAFGGTETLSLAYDLEIAQLAADVAFAFAPLGFAGAEASVEVRLLDLTVREEEPAIALMTNLTIGTTLDGAVDPYARIYSKLSLGSHWLSNTTKLSFIPFDVASSLLAYLSFGEFVAGDGGVTVTAYGYISLDIVPLDFGYVQANAEVTVDGITILNSVTYYGDTSFLAMSTVTLDLAPVTVEIWGSYSTSAADAFAVGASASFSWGPL